MRVAFGVWTLPEVGVANDPVIKKFAGSKVLIRIFSDIASLPICAITGLTKSLALWERWRRSRRRGQIEQIIINERDLSLP